MSIAQKVSLLFMRLALGCYMLYAGVSKLITPDWSAAGFLTHANSFSGMYAWFASSGNIGWVNGINTWGLVLLGVSLIFGMGVRLASLLGILLMALYYFPSLQFPYAGEHAYIVDEHIIYISILFVAYTMRLGRVYGLDGWCIAKGWYDTCKCDEWFG